MTFYRKSNKTVNWLNAGNLGGYTTRIAANPVNANKSYDVDNSESARSGANSVSGVKSASKFLTLYDVC